MKLHWIIDMDINGENHPDLAQTIRDLGHKVTPLSVTRDFPLIISNDDEIAIFHGSFEELNKVKKQLRVATYGLGPSISRSHYISYLPRNWFFNKDSTMTTWGLFCRSRFHDWFIRPDSGYKTFTGQVIHRDNFDNEVKLLADTSNVKPETIIWVSEPKKIDNEYRFWISDRKVVASTEYSWDDDRAGEIPENALKLAEEVARYEWQLDRIFVVDIAMSNDSASILEFNSFSCSGLYHCDSKALFKTVSEDIIAEWEIDNL